MKTFATLAFAAGMTVAFAGAGFAQSSMSKMSDAEKTQMTKCKGMGEMAMKGDKDCMALMKKYPETASPASGAKGAPKSR